MPQIFHRSFNTLAKVSIVAVGLLVATVGGVLYVGIRSAYATNEGITREQPVPFSHQHHVNELGIDCRYCHTSVEDSAFAGIPPTKTCMNCHSQIWVGSAMLAPVRESYKTDKSIQWTRVHKVGDYCYFDHSIHIAKGIGCVSCHGRVDQMQLVWQDKSLLMEWCLECHKAPEQFVRPKSQIYNFRWQPSDEMQSDGQTPHTRATIGPELVKKHNIKSNLSCSACHR